MKSYIQQQLGNRIKELRKIKGLSQEVLAEQIGIATNTLSSIETGNAFMTAQTLEKILEILNITPKELFTFPENTYNEDLYYSVNGYTWIQCTEENVITLIDIINNRTEDLKVYIKYLENYYYYDYMTSYTFEYVSGGETNE